MPERLFGHTQTGLMESSSTRPAKLLPAKHHTAHCEAVCRLMQDCGSHAAGVVGRPGFQALAAAVAATAVVWPGAYRGLQSK